MTTLLEVRTAAEDLLPTNEEITRQVQMTEVLLHGERPTTFLAWKTATVADQVAVDALLLAKVQRAVSQLLDEGVVDRFGVSLLDKQVRNRIRSFLQSVSVRLAAGDTVKFSLRAPLPVQYPSSVPPSVYRVLPQELPLVEQDPVRIDEFERICFGNRVRVPYRGADQFARYVFDNLLHASGVLELAQLSGIDTWQARLAALLERTNFCPRVALDAFYHQSVLHQGVLYDCSFVPKYDVRRLKSAHVPMATPSDAGLIESWATMDVRKSATIPEILMPIFRVFPFKDGHVVRPDGSIAAVTLVNCPRQLSSRLKITAASESPDGIEAKADDLARTVPYTELQHFVLYQAKTLREQAVGMMALRSIFGASMRLDSHRIPLPSHNVIMAWMTLPSNPPKGSTSRAGGVDFRSLLPPGNVAVPLVADIVQKAAQLVRDLASVAANARGAVIVASPYRIPECALTGTRLAIETQPDVDQATRHAQMYVLLGMVLQDYHNPTISVARERFGRSARFGRTAADQIDWSRYESLRALDRLDHATERYYDPQDQPNPVVMPTNVTCSEALMGLCPPESNPAAYRFRNPQLADLARLGALDVPLDERVQLAKMIAIALENSPDDV